jgi:hypothetical protein
MVLALEDGLVSWGRDDVIRWWDRQGKPSDTPWLAAARLEFVQVIGREFWVGLMGRPFRLLLSKRET